LCLPIAGTNLAEEIVLPYSRYNFRSSLKQEPIPLRKLFLPRAGTNNAAKLFLPSKVHILQRKLFLPIAGTNPAAEIFPSCSSYFCRSSSSQSKFRCGSFSFISQVQIPLLNSSSPSQFKIPQLKLFLLIAGTNPADEIVPPRSRHNCRSF